MAAKKTPWGYQKFCPESERVDVKSEVYLAMFRASMKEDRASVPSSYSAVEEGLVSPVRDQGQCGQWRNWMIEYS